MVTPSKIQALSDNIESIYQHMVDELLINIGRHITSPTWTHTASWEIQKLAELGQLTQENAAIINGWIKQMPPAIRQTMEATRAAALDQLEKQLEQAAKDGYITPAVTDRTVQILRDYQEQAASVYNMVNTTMLQSSVDQYARAVNLTDAEYGKLLAQREATNAILDEAAGNIAMGAETRQQAIRRAILKISDEGLTGFIDKAGRSWTPEAYVNMVTRTTVHNVAIQSTKARMQDYNTQVFQVSSHAAARPLCYPYQGKFYSWDNTAGEIELGNGSTVRYEPLNSTTYGQAAGLFGINCGHFPIPIIPGVTIPHGADNIQPKEENDREYKESQEQRALERQIREAKRNVEMLGDAATKEDKAKVRELQAKMREFTDRTGRARRYDRESIVTAKQASKTAQTTTAAQITVAPPKAFTLTAATRYTVNDLTKTIDTAYKFNDGSFSGVRKTAKAVIYETPDGTRFVFPSSYNKTHQRMTPEILLEAYNRVPQEIRTRGQKEIVIQDVYNPQDAYWRKRYKNFSHSYAIGGDKITFWRHDYDHDPDYLVVSLSHEMGHFIDWDGHYGTGARVSSGQDWANAMAADLSTSGKRSPTLYGENDPSEDFAESIATLVERFDGFKTEFPERFKIIEDLLTK